MLGSCPGVIFMDATLSWNFVSIVAFESERALKVFRILKSSFVIFAIGVSLITWNAFRFDVCIFLAFVPGIAMHVSSFVDSCPTSAISAMSDVAYFAAEIRFRAASVEARSIDFWEYVIAIGLFRFWMKNESAAAV